MYQHTCSLADFLPHYEFFIVVPACKPSVLCFELLHFAVTSVTELKKGIKILLILNRHEE